MKKLSLQKTISLIMIPACLYFACSNKNKEKALENKVNTSINQICKDKDTIIYHIIKKGDTYNGLAEEYWGTNKEADEIKKLNPKINYRELKIGQKIRVK